MTGDATVLRKVLRVWLLTATMAVVLATLAPSMAAAEPDWANEEALRNSSFGRDTFIYDPGRTHNISRATFAQTSLAGYYIARGFKANFLNWAPREVRDLGTSDWSGCEPGEHPNPCPSNSVDWGPVGGDLADSRITVLYWKGAFISVVCGNFSRVGSDGPTPPRVKGVKYEDLNGNGKRDAGEPGLGGWTIKLRHGGKVVASTTTAGNGSYTFVLDANENSGIGAGTYKVEEVLKSGWVAEETPGSFFVKFGSYGKTFGNKNFGNFRPATIAGHKFDDSNVNGEWDSEEVGLPGWGISLSNGEKQLTDGEGAFSFSVRPGKFTVSETLKEGWRQTAPGDAGTQTYTVISGQVVDDIEFGNVCLGALSVEAVDEDTGEPVPIEVRLEEVSVPGILKNEPTLPRTMTGIPTFDELLPGTYRVVAFLPDGYYTSDPDVESVVGHFAIVKEIEVHECVTEELELDVFTKSTPGLVTGGVKIPLPSGYATSGFEFMAETEDDARGTLQYNEHDVGPNPELNLHTEVIEALRIIDSEHAEAWGTVDVGGEPQRFYLRLIDAGEPGTADQYELELEGGYNAGEGETLLGGNVQIH